MIYLHRKLENGTFVQIKNIQVFSLESLFAEYHSIVKQLPGRENIFYTVNHSKPGSAREFVSTEYIPYDIDGVDKAKGPEAYLDAVSTALKLDKKFFTFISSGNGYHFLIRLHQDNYIMSAEELQSQQPYYKATIAAIEKVLHDKQLPGKVDMVFDTGRIFRMPGTINKKENRPTSECTILQLSNERSDFTLKSASPISLVPAVKRGSSTPIGESYAWVGGDPDTKAILTGCDFLKWAGENPTDVSEPQWYAMLSITARLDKGRELSHDLSKDHQHYSYPETEEKIDQAMAASGPRTCDSINMHWGKCKSCPNYGKVKSPIVITSNEFIPTEKTGFYTVTVSKNGNTSRTPDYNGLIKKFDQEHYHMAHPSRQVYRWNGSYYIPIQDVEIEGYAYERMNPSPSSTYFTEFKKRLMATNIITKENIVTLEGKLNLKNGVYDIVTKTLLPHSRQRFFTSQVDCDFVPGATCERFKAWLKEICSGDLEKVNALLDFMAYAMAGANISNELILVLTGEGQNGKTTFMKVMRKLFGTSMSSATAKEIADKNGKAKLEGKKICLMEEVPSYKDMDLWEQLKNIASGGTVSVERKYKDSYEMDVTCRLVMTCNKLPGGTDMTFGYLRRLLIIPFDYQVPEELRINSFENILAEELPGILNELLSRIDTLTKSNFKISKPHSSKEVLDEYELEKNIVARFVHERISVWNPENRLPKTVMISCTKWTEDGIPYYNLGELWFNEFKQWCEDEGIKPYSVEPKPTFIKKVAKIIETKYKIKRTETKVGGKNIISTEGIFILKKESSSGDF